MPPIVRMIALNNGLKAIVDAEDYERVNKLKWSFSSIGNTKYLSNRKMVDRKVTHTLLHRFIINAEASQLVDHINGDGLDNRKENLRIATKAQNSMNSKLHSRNTTGYRGVAYVPKADRYQARLCRFGKKITGKFRRSAIEAAHDYKEIALRVHGEFVRLEGGGLI